MAAFVDATRSHGRVVILDKPFCWFPTQSGPLSLLHIAVVDVVNIAHGEDLNIVVLQESFEVASAHLSKSDYSERDAIPGGGATFAKY